MGDSVLDYAPPVQEDELTIEARLDGGVTITIPTRRRCLSTIAARCARADLFGFLLIPFAWLVFLLLATRRPRAILHLTPSEFIVIQTNDEGLGYSVHTSTWAIASLAELRPNRYEPGLWYSVPGKESGNILADQPPEVLQRIGQALMEARARLAIADTA